MKLNRMMQMTGRLMVVVLMFIWPLTVIKAGIVETVEVKGRLFSDELNSKNVVIISSEDIEALKMDHIADIFNFFTGVQVSTRGGGEASFDMTMRGSNFEQVLVLVNGVPLNNPQTGHFNGDFPFSIHDIERVEIVRGGTSTTYGPGAFAGVVHFVLKKDTGFRFSVTRGENDFFSVSLQGGKRMKNLALRVSVERNNSAGYYEGQEFDQKRLTMGTFYEGKNLAIEFTAGYLQKEFGALGFYAPLPSVEKIQSYFYQVQVTQSYKTWDFTLAYVNNRHNDDFTLDRYRPGYFQNESDTTLNHVRLLARYNGKGFNMSGGGEFKRETMDSTMMGRRGRNRGGLFFNVNFSWSKRGGMDGGIRRNFEGGEPLGWVRGYSARSASNFTYYMGLYQGLAEGLTLRWGYGKSVRLPSFTELYYDSPANVGDERLKPEISHNYELSFSWLSHVYNLDISFFSRDQQNVIDWIKMWDGGSAEPWRAVNIEKNDVMGFEVTQGLTLDDTRLTLGIEWLTVVNNGWNDWFQSKYGLRFPDISIKFNVMQGFGKHLKAVASYNFKRIYEAGEEGHFLDLMILLSWGHVEIGLRGDNILGNIIEEIPGLKVPGRWFYLTLCYK